MADFLEQLKKQIATQLKASLGDDFDVSKLAYDDIEKLYSENVNGLKNKNTELIGKLKSQDGIIKQVDLDEYKKLKEEATQREADLENAEEEKAKAAKNIEALIQIERNKLLKSQERWTQEKTSLEQQVQSITGKYHTKLKDLALTEALKGIHVGDKFLKFVKSSFLSKAGIELGDNGQENIVINANGADIPIKDYFTTWAEEDEAKSVIVPPANSGGGAAGSNGGAAGSKTQQLLDGLAEAEKKGDTMTMIAIQQKLENMGTK
jgi:hypothetical protein